MAEPITDNESGVEEVRPWTAPTLTRLDLEEAEAGPLGTTDSGIFS